MNIIKNIFPVWRITLALILNLIIVFNIAVPSFHEQLHSHSTNELSCNETNEADACHQYLFHHKKSQECDGSHKHFASKHDNCFVCDYYQEKNFPVYNPIDAASDFSTSINASSTPYFENYTFDILLSYYLRGPPSIA